MPDVIVLSVAPSSGKTALALALRDVHGAVHLDLNRVRDFHLPPDWSGASLTEETMSTRLVFAMSRVYLAHRRVPVVVDDLRDQDAVSLGAELGLRTARIVSLVTEEAVIRQRLALRTSGFRDADEAVARNQALRARHLLPGELRIDMDGTITDELLARVLGS